MQRHVLLLTEEQGPGGVNTLLGLLEQTLTAQGWQVDTANVRHDRPRFLSLLARARRARVLVASNNFGPARWCVLLGLLVHRPSVVWVHGPLDDVLRQQPVSWLRRLLLRWTYHFADLLVFASQASQQALHRVVPAASLPLQAVIRNPAPPLAPPGPAPASGQGTALGFVGRLSAEKRPELLLEMLQHLPQDHHLTLVGDGPLRATLQQQAARLGLLAGRGQPARVRFVGAQNVSAATYQAWQATLLCSAYEGYPLAALESLAAGVPCVSTPLPALQDMLGPHAAHWLAPQDSPRSLAATLRRVLATEPGQRRQAAQALALQHPLQDFAGQWHAQLLRCTRQPRPGPRQVHFVHGGPAYMPELEAYAAHLRGLGHAVWQHRDAASVPVDADVVWWVCGRVSAHHSHRLRRSLQVHEYASASVGRWPAGKDLFKHWTHPIPDHRVFLNEWVRDRLGFRDGVSYSLRDMGVPPAFLRARPLRPVDRDLVYLGEMGRLREFLPTLHKLAQAGLRLLLVGQLPQDLQAALLALPGIECTGRVSQSEVPTQLLRARAGLNLMPERLPLTAQTSTKVLEYLAVGLPVISNDYPWMRRMALLHTDRIRLLPADATVQTWLAALQALPAPLAQREHLQHLGWPARLANLPIWRQLGLEGTSP